METINSHVWNIISQVAIIALAVAVIMQAVKAIFKLKVEKLRNVKYKKKNVKIEKMEKKTSVLLRLFPLFAIILGAGFGVLYSGLHVTGIVTGIAGGGISSWIYSLVRKTLQGK